MVSYVPCTEDAGSFTVSGCEEIVCSMPQNREGYDFLNFDDQVDDLRWNTFDVNSLTCMAGFSGSARAEPCDRFQGGEFELSGCIRRDLKSMGVEMTLDIVVQDTNNQVEMNAVQKTLEESFENSLNLHSGSVTTTSFVLFTQRRRALSSSETFVWNFEVSYSSSDTATESSLKGLADGSSTSLLNDFANEVETNAELNSDILSQDSVDFRAAMNVIEVRKLNDDNAKITRIIIIATLLAVVVVATILIMRHIGGPSSSKHNRRIAPAG